MMAKRPDDRYQAAREILNDLTRVKDGGSALIAPLPSGVSVFGAVGGSSTHVPTMHTSGFVTQPMPTRTGPWRYVVVGVLAIVAAAGGAALHWSQIPQPIPVKPDDALADVDPSPAVLRERELRRQLNDKAVRPEVAMDDLLELAELYINDRRFDDAHKLFDPEYVRKLAALEVPGKEFTKDRNDQIAILCGLGKGIVFAYQDKAEESNAEFLKLVRAYPPLKGDPPVPPKAKSPLRGTQIEQFFNRTNAGANWKRAVGEALERNARNLEGAIPEELKRLRMLPIKGPVGRPGRGES
jgi:hypothetical protein